MTFEKSMDPKLNLKHCKAMTWRNATSIHHKAFLFGKWIVFLLHTTTKKLSISI